MSDDATKRIRVGPAGIVRRAAEAMVKWWHVAVPAAVAGMIAVFGRRRTPPGPVSDFPDPLYVGKRGDPELEALLTELDDYLRSEGADSTISAAELTEMRKTDGYYAIPVRKLWPRMAYTVVMLWNSARREYGRPITVLNGYRPPDYNAAVGGAPGSHHQDGSAIDLTADDMDSLALILAELYMAHADELKMGLRIYGAPNARRAHMDAGTRSRPHKGAQTDYYLQQIGALP